jgi:hypothetical protein
MVLYGRFCHRQLLSALAIMQFFFTMRHLLFFQFERSDIANIFWLQCCVCMCMYVCVCVCVRARANVLPDNARLNPSNTYSKMCAGMNSCMNVFVLMLSMHVRMYSHTWTSIYEYMQDSDFK